MNQRTTDIAQKRDITGKGTEKRNMQQKKGTETEKETQNRNKTNKQNRQTQNRNPDTTTGSTDG
jgi:hypothetical protein